MLSETSPGSGPYKLWEALHQHGSQSKNEPKHDKTNKMTCAHSELRSAWAYGQWRLWADAQADRSLRCAHMPFCWFCQAVAQILLHVFLTHFSQIKISIHFEYIISLLSFFQTGNPQFWWIHVYSECKVKSDLELILKRKHLLLWTAFLQEQDW